MQKLFVVYNPRSSKSRCIKDEVLSKLTSLNGYMILKYEIKKTNFDDNVKTLSRLLEDNSLVISVGGDATAAICTNAILGSSKDVALAALPYGNFNDFARTLGLKSLDDILLQTKATNYYPLDIKVDGKHCRYAACYVTIGMTAAATKIFDQKKLRSKLKKSCTHSLRSYFSLAKWYFLNRHKARFMPEFTLNSRALPSNTSDYFASNGRSAAGIMKGGEEYRSSTSFISYSGKLISFWRLVDFMFKSIFFKIPGQLTSGDRLKFDKPSNITLQAEGESITINNCSNIEITKSTRPLKVIQA